ncbi:MAG: TadE/TadG family type IV pilus assembly protein [Chloroflexota bacterium]
MNEIMRRARGSQQGAAMVEFAIVAMVFFSLIFGLLDFGLAVFYHNMVANAAREGARFGVIDSRTPDQICQYTLTKAFVPGVPSPAPSCTGGALTAGQLTITTTDGIRRTMAQNAAGVTVETAASTPVVVTVTYGYQPITPMLQAIMGMTRNLTAQSSMFIED